MLRHVLTAVARHSRFAQVPVSLVDFLVMKARWMRPNSTRAPQIVRWIGQSGKTGGPAASSAAPSTPEGSMSAYAPAINSGLRRTLILILAAACVTVVLVASPARAILGSVSADWPAAKLKRGTTAYVTGKVTGLELGDGVFLQQKVLGGWRNVAKAKLDSEREYRLAIPTWWLGERTYRVKTGSLLDLTLLGTPSPSWTVTVIPTYDPLGLPRQHSWSSSTYMRWDPCSVVGVRVYADQAPAGAITDVKSAMKRIGHATGLKFAYRGRTSRIPQRGGNSWYPADTQIVVAWARKSQSSMFDGYSSAVAMGGAISSGGYQESDGTTLSRIIRGAVVIDSRQRFAGGFGGGYTRGDILLHELGHTMGLSHTGSTKQIMYKSMTSRAARLNKGDLTAMEKRGARLGCVTPVDLSSLRVNSTPVMHLSP